MDRFGFDDRLRLLCTDCRGLEEEPRLLCMDYLGFDGSRMLRMDFSSLEHGSRPLCAD